MDTPIFCGPVSFAQATFQQLIAKTAAFGTEPFCVDGGEDVSFKETTVEGTASFKDATFLRPVDFTRASFGRLEAMATQFINRDRYQHFNEMRVGSSAVFSNAVFAGDVSFSEAVIEGNFWAHASQFEGTEKDISFEGMQVGNKAIFRKVKFASPVAFEQMRVTGNADFNEADFREFVNFKRTVFGRLDMKKAQFQKIPLFSKMRVQTSAYFNETTFFDETFFSDAVIVKDLWAYKTAFKGRGQSAMFDGMQVSGHARFKEATFSGDASFKQVKVNSITFDDTTFSSKSDFDRMVVGDAGSFQRVTFRKQAIMKNATFNRLLITGNETDKHPNFLDGLDLSRTIVNRDLSIKNIKLNKLTAGFLEVNGPAHFSDFNIRDEVNLEQSSFQSLALCNVSVPKKEKTLKLHGMTFNQLGTTKGNHCVPPWQGILSDLPRDKILPWIFKTFSSKEVEYSPSFYAHLETFFKNQGDPALAADVFVAQKWHERSAVSRGLKKLWSIFLHFSVGDGRRPELAFLWSALVVLIGCWTFDFKKGMVLQNPAEVQAEDEIHRYNRLWYSLDVFLPFIDLKVDNVWIPRPDRKFALFYMHVQTILGWILIPIGLAAFAGILQ